MLFNSYLFIFVFLPLTLLSYHSLNKFKLFTLSRLSLILSSLIFYSYFTYRNLPILILSIVMNYFFSSLLQTPKVSLSKKALFYLGLVFNIGLLSLYKYSGFIFPLGLSFFTLQQVAYLVDSYEGVTERTSFLNYLGFICFFPTLISGPIIHHTQLMPQLTSVKNKTFTFNQLSLGIFLFTLGLVKKVLLAETFGDWARPGFDEALTLDLFAAWKTCLSYTFQLYFDFSGYSDMAIGLGAMFNLKLPQNFNSPFRSKSVIEFWTRWHITLSQFITTYIFTPLVRALPKMSFRNTMLATFLSMLLAGVWHGAGWTYVLYGALHGLALVVNHLWKKRKKKLSAFLAWFLTFNFINFTFVLFRAKDLESAVKVFKGMFGFSGVVVPKIGIKTVGILHDYGFSLGTYLYPKDYLFLALICGSFWACFKFKSSWELEKTFSAVSRLAILSGLAFAFSLFGMNRITEFIYFQF